RSAAHALVGWLLIDMGQDSLMGRLKAFEDQFVERIITQAVCRGGGEKLDHRIPKKGAGQFPGGFTPHSVGDKEVAIFDVDKTGVLVIRTC
ncbi:MAG: hypothetical protein KJO28_07815, partial [Desulfofustis sp.]|nr:hypothetical protein [Desulfofustis sp.]